MSRGENQTKEKIEFATRLIELCGTSEPAKVQRSLGISYQSAKNYLSGRYPDPEILIKIALVTGCSIDWLLTGRGEKIIESAPLADTLLSAGQIELVRKICVEVFNEKIGEEGRLKIVTIQSSEILSEKVPDESTALTGEPTTPASELRPA